MNQAIAAALAEEMERDERVVVFGEDVAVAEGVFKSSEGLLAKSRGRRRRGSADKALYRPAGELERWQARDPIVLYAGKLAESGELDGRSLDEIYDCQR